MGIGWADWMWKTTVYYYAFSEIDATMHGEYVQRLAIARTKESKDQRAGITVRETALPENDE